MVEKMTKEQVKELGYVCGFCGELHEVYVYRLRGYPSYFVCPDAPEDPPVSLVQPLMRASAMV